MGVLMAIVWPTKNRVNGLSSDVQNCMDKRFNRCPPKKEHVYQWDIKIICWCPNSSISQPARRRSIIHRTDICQSIDAGILESPMFLSCCTPPNMKLAHQTMVAEMIFHSWMLPIRYWFHVKFRCNPIMKKSPEVVCYLSPGNCRHSGNPTWLAGQSPVCSWFSH